MADDSQHRSPDGPGHWVTIRDRSGHAHHVFIADAAPAGLRHTAERRGTVGRPRAGVSLARLRSSVNALGQGNIRKADYQITYRDKAGRTRTILIKRQAPARGRGSATGNQLGARGRQEPPKNPNDPGQPTPKTTDEFIDERTKGRLRAVNGASTESVKTARQLDRAIGVLTNPENTHAALDAAGLVDPTGAADILNGIVYLSRGKFADAAISFGSALPLGDGLKLLRGSKRLKKAEATLASIKTFGRKPPGALNVTNRKASEILESVARRRANARAGKSAATDATNRATAGAANTASTGAAARAQVGAANSAATGQAGRATSAAAKSAPAGATARAKSGTTNPALTKANVRSKVAGSLTRNDDLLAKNLGGRLKSHTPHHLIGVAEARKFDVMRRAADLGYDINRGSNGINLPNKLHLAKKLDLPNHPPRGRHSTRTYTGPVNDRLSKLQDRYDAGIVTDDTLLEEIKIIERGIRTDLLDYVLRLNSRY